MSFGMNSVLAGTNTTETEKEEPSKYTFLKWVSCLKHLKEDEANPELQKIFHYSIHNCISDVIFFTVGFIALIFCTVLLHRFYKYNIIRGCGYIIKSIKFQTFVMMWMLNFLIASNMFFSLGHFSNLQ